MCVCARAARVRVCVCVCVYVYMYTHTHTHHTHKHIRIQKIGRQFSRHPHSRVHPLLGNFTLDRTSIISYELGSGIEVCVLCM